MKRTQFFVGVDLGKVRDYTAIAVVERAELTGQFDAAVYAYKKVVALRLRHLERVPLGTPYPEVADRLSRVTQSPELSERCQMAVDARGVGRAVVDLIDQARPGCQVLPVLVTSGEKETLSDGHYGVPKKDLMVGLQVILQMGELEVAAGMEHYDDLLAEMAAMEVRVSESGREQYGAWREGTHDDLVFAVALALWAARKKYPRRRGGDGWWQNGYQDEAKRLIRF
jgi:hypothetical protein